MKCLIPILLILPFSVNASNSPAELIEENFADMVQLCIDVEHKGSDTKQNRLKCAHESEIFISEIISDIKQQLREE